VISAWGKTTITARKQFTKEMIQSIASEMGAEERKRRRKREKERERKRKKERERKRRRKREKM
jgi:hypothetical protein